MKYNINLHRLLFYHVTYFFMISCFAVVYMRGWTLVILGLRDSWTILFLIILIKKKELTLLIFLFLGGLLGIIGILDSNKSFNIIVYLYGLRDLFLLAYFVFYLCEKKQHIKEIEINIFIAIVLFFALLELLSSILGFNELFQNIYQSDIYFFLKGINSHLQGGFLGDRLTAPFYSASLLGTCLSFYFITNTKFFMRYTALLVSAFTLSKAIVVIIFINLFKKLFKKHTILFIFLSMFSLFLLEQYINLLINNNELPLITYHLSSIKDRFTSFSLFQKNNMDWLSIDYLGYNSIAGHLLNGLDPNEAPESLLLAKFFDLKIYILIIVFPFLLKLRNINQSQIYLLAMFIFIQLFSSLSNHPVAFAAGIMIYHSLQYDKIVTVHRMSIRPESQGKVWKRARMH